MDNSIIVEKNTFRYYITQIRFFGHSIVYIFFFCLLSIYSDLFKEPVYFIFLILLGGVFIIGTEFIQKFSQDTHIFSLDPKERVINVLKLIGYVFIGLIFFVSPPGAPPQFIVPLIASLDYYLILSIYWSGSTLVLIWYLVFPKK